MRIESVSVVDASSTRKLNAYWELTKPRLVLLALVTTLLGYFLAHRELHGTWTLFWTLLSTASSYAGAATLNHALEIDRDRLMNRTMHRPLPRGILSVQEAFVMGVGLVVIGIGVATITVNGLAALMLAATVILYVGIYTPMKTRTPFNTLVGSLPGALPPLVGWCAAEGAWEARALIPFGILFAWQQPHFYAIAWLYRRDYEAGGFKMWPVVDPSGKWTFIQIFAFTLILIHLSIAPGLWGSQGFIYISGVLILSAILLGFCFDLLIARTDVAARRFVRMTIVYLPVLFLLTLIDAGFRL